MKIKTFSTTRMGHTFRTRLTGVPDGETKVIQPKNILWEGLVFRDNEPLRINLIPAKPLQTADVLLVSRGRFAAAVFDYSEPGVWVTPSSVLVLSIFDQKVLPEYVALYLNSSIGQNMYNRHFEQTTVPFISTKNLGEMYINIPSLQHQKDLVAFEKSTMQFTRLSNRKQKLLKEILNGNLKAINAKGNQI